METCQGSITKPSGIGSWLYAGPAILVRNVLSLLELVYNSFGLGRNVMQTPGMLNVNLAINYFPSGKSRSSVMPQVVKLSTYSRGDG